MLLSEQLPIYKTYPMLPLVPIVGISNNPYIYNYNVITMYLLNNYPNKEGHEEGYQQKANHINGSLNM